MIILMNNVLKYKHYKGLYCCSVIYDTKDTVRYHDMQSLPKKNGSNREPMVVAYDIFSRYYQVTKSLPKLFLCVTWCTSII